MDDDAEISMMLFPDPVIALYMKGIDRTLIRENLRLTPDERVRKFARFMRGVSALRREQETLRARDEP